jgi:hypothetical protein
VGAPVPAAGSAAAVGARLLGAQGYYSEHAFGARARLGAWARREADELGWALRGLSHRYAAGLEAAHGRPRPGAPLARPVVVGRSGESEQAWRSGKGLQARFSLFRKAPHADGRLVSVAAVPAGDETFAQLVATERARGRAAEPAAPAAARVGEARAKALLAARARLLACQAANGWGAQGGARTWELLLWVLAHHELAASSRALEPPLLPPSACLASAMPYASCALLRRVALVASPTELALKMLQEVALRVGVGAPFRAIALLQLALRLVQPCAPAGCDDEGRAEALLIDAAASALRYLVPLGHHGEAPPSPLAPGPRRVSSASEAADGGGGSLDESASLVWSEASEQNASCAYGVGCLEGGGHRWSERLIFLRGHPAEMAPAALALGTTIGERVALGEALALLEALTCERLRAFATELGKARGALRLRQWAALAQLSCCARYDPVRAELGARAPDDVAAAARALIAACLADGVCLALDGADLDACERVKAAAGGGGGGGGGSAAAAASSDDLLLDLAAHAQPALRAIATRLLDAFAPVCALRPSLAPGGARGRRPAEPLTCALAAAADHAGGLGGGRPGGLLGGPYALGALVHAALVARLRGRLRALCAALGSLGGECSARACEIYADALDLEASVRARVEASGEAAAAAAGAALAAELRALFEPSLQALLSTSLAELRQWAKKAVAAEPFDSRRPRGAATARPGGMVGRAATSAPAAVAAAAAAAALGGACEGVAWEGVAWCCACVLDFGKWGGALLDALAPHAHHLRLRAPGAAASGFEAAGRSLCATICSANALLCARALLQPDVAGCEEAGSAALHPHAEQAELIRRQLARKALPAAALVPAAAAAPEAPPDLDATLAEARRRGGAASARRAARYASSCARFAELARALGARLGELAGTAEGADEWLDGAYVQLHVARRATLFLLADSLGTDARARLDWAVAGGADARARLLARLDGRLGEVASSGLDADGVTHVVQRLWHAHLAPRLAELARDPTGGGGGGGGDYRATRAESARACSGVRTLLEQLRIHLHCGGDGLALAYLDAKAADALGALRLRLDAPTTELLGKLADAEAAANGAGAAAAAEMVGALAGRMDEPRAADAVRARRGGGTAGGSAARRP